MTAHPSTRCRRCLLPSVVPHSKLDESGVCRFCRENIDELRPWQEHRHQYQADLKELLKACRASTARYQALVCLSGGKDSLLLLYKLKVEEGLRVLAFTTDSDIPELAWLNIRTTIQKLGVDHIIYRPDRSFYKKLFHYLLMNQEERGAVYTVSYVYAPLFEGDAIRTATQQGIPAVFAGYSPGQPVQERMIYEFEPRLVTETDWTPPQLRSSGAFSREELLRFWNPSQEFPSGTPFPRYIAPFHAWPYDQEEAMKQVVKLGLVQSASHASPIRSNYPINWLLMYSDLRHFGYNPYAPEFCALIRAGKADWSRWSIAMPLVDFMIRHKVLLGAEIKRSMKWLELNDGDLQINQPRGAYDPPIRSSRLVIENRKST